MFALLSFLYGRQKLASRRQTNDKVRQLVKTALSELAKQVSNLSCALILLCAVMDRN